MTTSTMATPHKHAATPGKHAKAPADEHWLLLFAPTDADGHFLHAKQQLAEAEDELKAANVHVLEVFESLEVHTGERVAAPEIAPALRDRYNAPKGIFSAVFLALHPVARLEGALEGEEILATSRRVFGLPH